jgi:hypothetical protein
MSQRIRADAQKLTHDNYTAATTPTTKPLPKGTSSLLIQNMDATDNVLVSFDAGATFKTIRPGVIFTIGVDNLLSYVVKSSANTPASECIYSSEL